MTTQLSRMDFFVQQARTMNPSHVNPDATETLGAKLELDRLTQSERRVRAVIRATTGSKRHLAYHRLGRLPPLLAHTTGSRSALPRVQTAARPPSTGITAPWTKLAASVVRNRIVSAISCGEATRPAGEAAAI